MEEVNETAGICLLVETKLVDEFKTNQKYTKRTSKALADKLNLDKDLVEFILKESFYFRECEGCKGNMWEMV